MAGKKFRYHFSAWFYTLLVIATLGLITYSGYAYYSTDIETRYYHDLHQLWKSSGLYGHGFGIIGTLMILIGVFGYMARKRFRSLSRIGVLRSWLLLHIFLCVEGSVLILFHTSFKFGGIVAISFWSMVAVVLSGVMGRYIYMQIPRTIEGREMSPLEIDELKFKLRKKLNQAEDVDEDVLSILDDDPFQNIGFFGFLFKTKTEKKAVKRFKAQMNAQEVSKKEANETLKLFKDHLALKKRVSKLVSMKKLFSYWHVAHLPFALVMLVIMIIHVAVALVFGYKWIF